MLTGGRDRNRMTVVRDFNRERPVLVTKQADGGSSYTVVVGVVRVSGWCTVGQQRWCSQAMLTGKDNNIFFFRYLAPPVAWRRKGRMRVGCLIDFFASFCSALLWPSTRLALRTGEGRAEGS